MFLDVTGKVLRVGKLAVMMPVRTSTDGRCVGAGAAIAMAADMRFGTERQRDGARIRILGAE